MKHLILALLLFFMESAGTAQCCPYLGSISTHPQSLDNSVFVQILAQATTPNQATRINHTFTLNTQQNTIEAESCYFMSTTSGPSFFMDTFAIGYLNPGNYSIHFKAFISSSQSACVATSSNAATFSFVVSSISALPENKAFASFQVFPNPVKNKLNLEGTALQLPQSTFQITNALGQLLYGPKALAPKQELDLDALPGGIYFLQLQDPQGQKIIKLVKE